jgi:predicted transcriptional regulator
MTAKQALRDYIDRLSEEDALSLLQRIQLGDQGPRIPLSEDEMESVRRALADAAAGRVYSTAEVRQHLGLNA